MFPAPEDHSTSIIPLATAGGDVSLGVRNMGWRIESVATSQLTSPSGAAAALGSNYIKVDG